MAVGSAKAREWIVRLTSGRSARWASMWRLTICGKAIRHLLRHPLHRRRREVDFVEKQDPPALAWQELGRIPARDSFLRDRQAAQIRRRELRETHVNESQPVRGGGLRDNRSLPMPGGPQIMVESFRRWRTRRSRNAASSDGFIDGQLSTLHALRSYVPFLMSGR